VKQTLETLVDSERLELVGDDHAYESAHSGVHTARRSTYVDDRQSLVLDTRIFSARVTSSSGIAARTSIFSQAWSGPTLPIQCPRSFSVSFPLLISQIIQLHSLDSAVSGQGLSVGRRCISLGLCLGSEPPAGDDCSSDY